MGNRTREKDNQGETTKMSKRVVILGRGDHGGIFTHKKTVAESKEGMRHGIRWKDGGYGSWTGSTNGTNCLEKREANVFQKAEGIAQVVCPHGETHQGGERETSDNDSTMHS